MAKTFVQTCKDFLNGLYHIRLEWSRKVVTAGLTVTNFEVQSIGNRSTRGKMTVNFRRGNKRVKAVLTEFRPARQYTDIYDGEITPTDKSFQGSFWGRCANNSHQKPEKEAIALLAYFVTQLYTGSMFSVESAIKTRMLEYGLECLKPQMFTIVWEYSENVKVTLNLDHIKHLLEANRPKMQLSVDVLPKAYNRKTPKTHNMVDGKPPKTAAKVVARKEDTTIEI
jgi:hypothetical protein